MRGATSSNGNHGLGDLDCPAGRKRKSFLFQGLEVSRYRLAGIIQGFFFGAGEPAHSVCTHFLKHLISYGGDIRIIISKSREARGVSEKMTGDMDITEIQKSQAPCCEIVFASVESYPEDGRAKIAELMPDARTVAVLGHHVEASLEWVWYPSKSERGGITCGADLHAKAAIENISKVLESNGCRTLVLPYPKSCGISFKRLAAGTDMGEMGYSFLFLHREWGPWVHLRVLLTDADITETRALEAADICLHCESCIEACPGQCLSIGHHDRAACRRCQQAESDRLGIRGTYIYECEVCARACPVGDQPLGVIIHDGEIQPGKPLT